MLNNILNKLFMRKASVTESIFITTQTQVVSRSTLIGCLDINSFYTGLKCLESKYEALRCCIVKQNDDFFFVHKPEGISTKIIILDSPNIAIDSIYRQLLGIKLDLSTELYRLYVLQQRNSYEIFMLTSHAITDAQSLVVLHSNLIYFLDQISRGILPQISFQPFTEDIDTIIARFLENYVADSAQHLGSKEMHEVDLLRLDADNTLSDELGHEFSQLLIESTLLRRILDCCHKRNVSLHSLLTAVFAHAFKQVCKQSAAEHIIIRSSADLRRRVNPPVAMDLIQTAATAYTIRLNTNHSLWDISHQVSDCIYQANTHNTIVNGHLKYCRNFAAVATKQNYAINLSNIGAVHAPQTDSLTMQGFEYALGWDKAAPSVSISTFINKMVINLTFMPRFISRDEIKSLFAFVLDGLIVATVD